MSGGKDCAVLIGVVVDHSRGDMHRVRTEVAGREHIILARRAGRLIKHKVRCLPGDRVEVEVSPYDLTRGRIIYRGERPSPG